MPLEPPPSLGLTRRMVSETLARPNMQQSLGRDYLAVGIIITLGCYMLLDILQRSEVCNIFMSRVILSVRVRVLGVVCVSLIPILVLVMFPFSESQSIERWGEPSACSPQVVPPHRGLRCYAFGGFISSRNITFNAWVNCS
jgi:hypothetical protein